jgi:hypothetical protein
MDVYTSLRDPPSMLSMGLNTYSSTCSVDLLHLASSRLYACTHRKKWGWERGSYQSVELADDGWMDGFNEG